MVGARHRIGAQERPVFDLDADHGELAVHETEGRITRDLEAEEILGPVADVENAFLIEIAHAALP